jgi:HSP20 family protein
MALPTRVARQQNGQEPFESMQREFDHMLGRFFGAPEMSARAYSPYGVDVREDSDHLYVEAELPGFKKEDIDITLENQTLTISADRSEERKDGNGNGGNGGNAGGGKKGEWLLNERRHTRFLRSFTLPSTVSDQKVDAKLNDGVLTITLNKREETKPRKIQVS